MFGLIFSISVIISSFCVWLFFRSRVQEYISKLDQLTVQVAEKQYFLNCIIKNSERLESENIDRLHYKQELEDDINKLELKKSKLIKYIQHLKSSK